MKALCLIVLFEKRMWFLCVMYLASDSPLSELKSITAYSIAKASS